MSVVKSKHIFMKNYCFNIIELEGKEYQVTEFMPMNPADSTLGANLKFTEIMKKKYFDSL